MRLLQIAEGISVSLNLRIAIEAGSIKHASDKEQFKVQCLSQIRL